MLWRALWPVALLLLVSASGDARQPAVSGFTVVTGMPRSVKAVADFRGAEWSSEWASWRVAEPLDYREIAVERSVPTCLGGGGSDCDILTSF